MNFGSKKFLGIQYLRAIAALMVVWNHLVDKIPSYTSFLTPPPWINANALSSGVDIFFVISGFVMMMTAQQLTPQEFVRKRLIRIVPLYWLLTLTLFAVGIMAPSVFQYTRVDGGALVKSLLFIPFHNAGHNGELTPLLIPGWTLNLEMFFYALFAVTLFAQARYRLLICGVVLAALVAIGDLLPTEYRGTVAAFYCNHRMAEFFFGMVIAEWQLRYRSSVHPLIGAALMAAGFVWLLGAWNWHVDALAASAVVLGAIWLENSGWVRHAGWALLLGDASYSLYLTHVFTLGAARALWGRFGWVGIPSASAYLFFAASMIAATVVAVAVYCYIEMPAINIARLIKWRRYKGAVAYD